MVLVVCFSFVFVLVGAAFAIRKRRRACMWKEIDQVFTEADADMKSAMDRMEEDFDKHYESEQNK